MKRLGKVIKATANEINLAQATSRMLKESEAIKEDVRSKLAGIAQENRNGTAYENLVSIHNKIEELHDLIYKRPESGNSKESAINDCNLLLGQQRVHKANFDRDFNLFIAPPLLDAAPRLRF